MALAAKTLIDACRGYWEVGRGLGRALVGGEAGMRRKGPRAERAEATARQWIWNLDGKHKASRAHPSRQEAIAHHSDHTNNSVFGVFAVHGMATISWQPVQTTR